MSIRDEDGQSLLLALGFLLFCGVLIAAMISFAQASVLATERLREQRAVVYAADGAIDAAIQVGRLYPGVGAYGTAPCMQTQQFTTAVTTWDNKTLTATVYCKFLQSVQDDRRVEFRACVDGVVVVKATVRYYDHTDANYTYQTPPGPQTEVQSWTSSSATGQCADG
jgi:type II secretory pathway pseudopilin PulG